MNNQSIKRTSLREKGITLVALVVTIIILLILAGVAITSVTGDNGLFRKAKEATEISDIAETKEQIVMELTATSATIEKQGEYNNQDVIKAVKKITGKDVEEMAASVESKKGNNVDISDLWKQVRKGKFTLVCESNYLTWESMDVEFEEGMTWDDFFEHGNPERLCWFEDLTGIVPGSNTENNNITDEGHPVGRLYYYGDQYQEYLDYIIERDWGYNITLYINLEEKIIPNNSYKLYFHDGY